MEDFPKAKDLRAQMNEAQTVAAQNQIMDIRVRISRAVEQGQSSVEVTRWQPGVRELIEDKGYQITHFSAYDQRDSEYWKVSW